MKNKNLLNQNWEFAKFSLGHGKVEIEKGFNGWAKIALPHDWQIFDTADLYENAEGWYRRILPLALTEGERVILYFEGVYMETTLYVNGSLAGEWKYGYTSFHFDITDYVKDGDNEILVQTCYRNPNTRWYSGAGIYRDVWLYQVPAVHFEPDSMYVTTKCEQGPYGKEELQKRIEAGGLAKEDITETGTWAVQVQAEIRNGAAFLSRAMQEAKEGCVRFRLKDGVQEIAVKELSLEEAVGEDAQGVAEAVLQVENPKLWSAESPSVYEMEVQLVLQGQVVDTLCNTMGFRVFTYDPARGFFVNGVYTKMKGVCLHHDLGALGSAFHKVAMERQIRVLQEMGSNAIRTSHNPPSPQLLELADKMGMYVVDEAFDMWERPKTEFDYARFFTEWSAKDVASWVRRDRNHPSIVMWSIGNEIGDTNADAHGQELSRYLMAEVHKHDPLHNATVTIGSNYMMTKNGQKCADIVKMAGYNYAARFYEKHHAEYPDWCIYGSETSSTVQSRGVYHFPLKHAILTDDDEQCSSLGNSTVSWGAKDLDQVIWEEREYKYSLGQFLWTGFDYIGEPTPYATKNSYFGMVDTAGFPKDAFYVMQAAWRDVKKYPMVHLYPYWDFNPGQLIDIRVCSNAPEVELFFCPAVGKEHGLGKSLGKQKIDQKHGRTIHANWQLAYEPGVLTAIAYDEEGQEIARDVKQSFGNATKIRLCADKNILKADGKDMAFLEISMVDENGIAVENANNRVKVEVSGAGMLVGLDNGDSTDYESYKGLSRRLFSGKLMAMIAAGTEAGEIEIKVSSKGMETQTLVLNAEGSGEQGYTPYMANSEEMPSWAVLLPENRPEGYGKPYDMEELPVRKLELLCDTEYLLTPERKEIIVEAVSHPVNATYSELEWRVIGENGLDIPFAKLEKQDETGKRVKVSAIGDGSFILRCAIKNGGRVMSVMSQIEMTAEGFGSFSINPYELVPAARYSESSGDLGSGLEKGITTPYDIPVWMLYKNVDFGRFGADEITLPVFELNSVPITFTFWDGIPHAEGSSIVGTGVYHKETIWDVYQEETFRLNHRLKGSCNFAIELTGKTNIKGFRFSRPDKAYALIPVVDNDGLYGDSFTLEEDAITGIGNNVSVEFRDMDFAEKAARKLYVYGRTPLDCNTIQIRFTAENDGEAEEISVMAGFVNAREYTWQSFEIPEIKGKQKVTFVFLPGCNFDFKAFRFE